MKTWDILKFRSPGIKPGFLLFEVAVAVLVVSVGIIFIIRSFSRTLNSARFTMRYYHALQLLENKAWDLAILDIKGQSPEALSIKQGEFRDNPDFGWSIDVEPIEGLDLNQLELTVSWPQNKTRQSVSVATYAHTE